MSGILDNVSDLQSHAQNSAFHRLPAEILGLITDFLFKHPAEHYTGQGTGIENLRNLRLVHRSFAHLQPLLATLFQTIVLVPDLSQKNFDWTTSELRGCVKEVAFKIAMRPVWSQTDVYCNDSAEASVKKELAQQDMLDDYISSGRLQSVWVNTLKQLPRLTSVKINADWHHNFNHFPNTEELHPLAISCLKQANVAPTALLLSDEITKPPKDDIGQQYTPSEKPQWVLPQWREQLDLTKLKKLALSDDGFEWFLIWPDPELAGKLPSVLQRCATSIEEFAIWSCQGFLYHNPGELPIMPKLRSIEVHECCIVPRAIAQWISYSPSLESLFIAGRFTFDDEEEGRTRISDLRPMFDAIRDHPSKMLVDLEITEVVNPWHAFNPVEWSCASMDLFLKHHTASKADNDATIKGYANRFPMTDPAIREDLCEGIDLLKNYISGLCDWKNPTDSADRW